MCTQAAVLGLQAIGTAQAASAANTAGQSKNAYYQYMAAQNLTQANAVKTTADQNIGIVQSAAGREETNLNRTVATTEGAQKSGMAANGVWGGSGSAGDVINDTENKAALDRAAIRTNANLKVGAIAKGATDTSVALTTQAGQYEAAGGDAATAGRTNAFTSVLSGATQMASNWYKWKQTQPSGGSGGSGSTPGKVSNPYDVEDFG